MMADGIEAAIRAANRDGRMALVAYLTAGIPTLERFPHVLASVASLVDVLEVGVPFSDPMADGVSIQRASHEALRNGVTLPWILNCLEHVERPAPTILMSYFNPLLALGLERLATAVTRARVAGFIIPDLPYEEAGPFLNVVEHHDLDLIQLVTPATPMERCKTLCNVARGFVYAVTSTGTTGGTVDRSAALEAYLDRVRAISPRPVLAGFGIRFPEQVRKLQGHADGVIVGSALVDRVRNGDDVASFLHELRDAAVSPEVSS